MKVGYRPVRIATLIREGNLDDLANAAAANTHVWGGIHNPIIPVGESVEDAMALVETFRPDLVPSVSDATPVQTEVLKRNAALLATPRGPSRQPFEFMAEGGLPYTDVRLLCRHYRGQLTAATSNAIFVDWGEHDDDALNAVLFGRYRRDGVGNTYRAHFVQGLSAGQLPALHAYGRAHLFTPLVLTAADLQPLVWSPDRPWTGVIVGDPSDAKTLLAFWNLRSVGANVYLWPTTEHPELAAGASNSLRARSDRITSAQFRHVDICSVVEDQEVPEALAALLDELVLDHPDQVARPPEWTDAGVVPRVWATKARQVLATIEPTSGGRSRCVIGLPPRPFPDGDPTGLSLPKWLVNVETYTSLDINEPTLNVPAIPSMINWASDRIAWGPAVRLQDQGISVFADVDDVSVELNRVQPYEVVQQVFGHAGLDASTSAAGEATDRIVRQMGGLVGSRKLRLPGLRELLRHENKAYTHKQVINKLHDGGTYKRYFGVPKNPADLFADLLERKVFHPALHVRCPECKVDSPHLPSEVGMTLSCPRCRSTFDLAPLLEAAEWRYAPSGFFANLQTHGSIPVVLAMMAISEMFMIDPLWMAPSQTSRDQGSRQRLISPPSGAPSAGVL